MAEKHNYKVGDMVVLIEAPKYKGMIHQLDDYNGSGMVYITWNGRGGEAYPYYPSCIMLEADHLKNEAVKKAADEKEQNKQG